MSNRIAAWTAYLAVRDALGVEASMRLVEVSGGGIVYVPQKPSDGLNKRLGEDVADVLVRRYPGCYVEVPSLHSMSSRRVAAERRRVIAESRRSAAELARMLGCTSRRVRQIRREIGEAESDQPALF